MFRSFRAPGLGALLLLTAASAAHAHGPRLNAVEPPTPPAPPTPRAAPAPIPVVAPMPPIPPAPPSIWRMRHMLPPKAWYGVSLRCSDCSIRQDEDDHGLEWRFRSEPEISGIEPDSPAERAGVKDGDVITKVNGKSITSRDGGREFGGVKPGDKVKWTVERDSKPMELTLTADERPDDWTTPHAMNDETMRKVYEELLRAHQQMNENMRGTNRQAIENAMKEVEDARRQLRQARAYRYDYDYDDSTPIAGKDGVFVVPKQSKTRSVRYTGEVGTSHVEVRGTSRVVVTEKDDGGIVIDTPDATIRVEKVEKKP
jgi:membrane-associated protease RseP (regulator of RpoE activity)